MKRSNLSAAAALILAAGTPALAQTAWGIWNNGPGGQTIVTFDVNTPGTFATIGPTGIAGTIFINSLEFGPGGANLYLATNSITGYFHDVDQTTGAATNPRGTGLATGDTLGDLSYDSFAGRMLGIGTPGVAGAGSRLYAINLVTGDATNLGTITGYTDGFTVSLAVRPSDGLIFVHGIETDQWYTVNPSTLAATPLGPIGWNTNFGQGASFFAGSSTLYHTILTVDGGNQSRLATIDQGTGVPSFLGTLGVGLNQVGDIAFAPASTSCYANCDNSTGTPLLTANDFQCFLNKYAANDTYANCDNSTGTPLLTANDFQCFLNKYAAGCS